MRRLLLAATGLAGFAACERADATLAEAPQPVVATPTEDADMSIHSTMKVEDPPPAPPAPRPPPGSGWYRGLSGQRRTAAAYLCKRQNADPCINMPGRPGLRKQENAELEAALAQFTADDGERLQRHCDQVYPRREVCDTPLVVSFDGGAVALEPASAARFAFRPGVPAASEWPAPATPWIALDRDGDGTIGAGDELFGDSSPLPDGTTAHDGFAALAALDANHDGRIDRDDPAFASLLLWSDTNGDHQSSPDELVPLSSVVIAIPLAHDGVRGALTWRAADGTSHTGAVIDLYLRELL